MLADFQICISVPLNNRMTNMHYRPLKIVYRNKKLNFKYLLQKDKAASILKKNLQYLAIYIYKITNGLSSIVLNKGFTFQENGSMN